MSTAYGGYMGPYLDIDLSTGTIGTYEISNQDREVFLGNKGLAAKILYDNLTPGIDPLSPDNIMVINTGPLTGTGAPCSSRFNMSTKSAMTGGIASSNCGGNFGLYLKKAGYDGLIIRGRAPKPVYLTINETGVSITEASYWWGLNTEEVQEQIVERFGKKIGMLVIGPAGENLVRYACVLSGERALGRTGTGAVMGSKNLKAVLTWGQKPIPIHDPSGFKSAVKSWINTLRANPITGKTLPNYGTANLVNTTSGTYTLPTKNFMDGTYSDANKISGEQMAETDYAGNSGCVSCPIRCARNVMLDGKRVKGPEFETVGLWGANILNNDLRKIYKWNYIMDLYGMDTISCGGSIAFAMELNEKGLWENGLKFGEFDNINKILEDIAYRKGIGDELAEGVMRLSDKYGGKEFAMHSKGLEFASYEPRGAVGHGLGYATSNRGGCHINGGYLVFFEAVGPLTVDALTPKLKPALLVFNQNALEAVSVCGNCIFTTYAIVPGVVGKMVPKSSVQAKLVSELLVGSSPILELQDKLEEWMLPIHVPLIPQTKVLTKLTGMDISLGKFIAIGEAAFNMERIFNLREGFTSDDDSLPDRLTKEQQRPDVPDSIVRLDEMLPIYYKVRGWDEQGIPTPEKLKRMDMLFLNEDVEKIRSNQDNYKKYRQTLLKKENQNLKKVAKQNNNELKEIEPERDQLKKDLVREEIKIRNAKMFGHRFFVDNGKCRECGLCYEACPNDAILWEKGKKAFILQNKCIRCGKCYIACPTHFSAIALQFDQELYDEKSQIIYISDSNKCIMCGKCYRTCGVDAVVWAKKKKSFLDPELCIRCGKCEENCPTKASAIFHKTEKNPAIPKIEERLYKG